MTNTVTALARRYQVDVSADGSNWTQLKGINDLKPDIKPKVVDSTDYESNGWSSSEVTMYDWKLTVKVNRETSAGVFDAGQELVRACVAQFGTSARVYVRWYDKNGAPEAWSGYALVEWSRTKTGVADLDEAEIVLAGDGQLTAIANPYSASSVPVVTNASPAGAASGAQLSIFGSGFTGTTSVKFGATSVPTYTVVSDQLIVAVIPAGGTGSQSIVVTNATGPSVGFTFNV